MPTTAPHRLARAASPRPAVRHRVTPTPGRVRVSGAALHLRSTLRRLSVATVLAATALALGPVTTTAAGAAAGAAGQTAEATRAARAPDIVVILSDDIGYSDIGSYGGEIPTPQLDTLAAGGVRFTQFYNTARCCPTRASLLTGLHPHQAGVGHMMEDRGHPGYRGTLNDRCVTAAEALAGAGYRSYAVGKWHVTPGHNAAALADTRNWPLQRGFQRFYGTIHGAGSYFDPSSLVRDNRLITSAADPDYAPTNGYYYTDAIAEHAVRFVQDHARQHGDAPLFLYTAFTAAHWPLHARDEDIARHKGRYDGGYEPVRAARLAKQRSLGLPGADWTANPPAERWDEVKDKAFEARCMEVYAAQIESMDRGIGRIVSTLRDLGRLDNTLILYLQDNGGCAEGVGRGPRATPRAAAPTLPPMAPADQQFNSIPTQTRDGWPVRQGLGVMPGGPDTYIAYGRGWANVSNTPFREYKHWTHEGGIATPLIAHWPAGLRTAQPRVRQPAGGRLVHEPAQLPDILATCLDVAGAAYPATRQGQPTTPLPGRSLRPLITGADRSGPPRLLFWEHEGNRAVRDGRWKLVAKENLPWELYDIETDRTERRNLAAAQPDRVKTLAAEWDRWAARSSVLPLGGWRGAAATSTNLNPARRFALTNSQRLDRTQAPAIARRPFRITTLFEAPPGARGVLLAHGGSVHGYSLYVADGALHFLVRSDGRAVSVRAPFGPSADRILLHSATASLNATGRLSLILDDAPPVVSEQSLVVSTMPVDGLEVGRDLGGPVGPYAAPNPFTGLIENAVIELDPSSP